MPHQVVHMRKLRNTLSTIQEKIYTPLNELRVTAWITSEPVDYPQRMTGEKKTLKPGDKWGNLWDCGWFHFEGTVPASAAGSKIVLLIDVNGELCLVDDEGTPTQGLTNVNSEFDKSLGLPGKRVVHISDCASGNEPIDLWGDAGCNDLFGGYRTGTLKEAWIAICHEETRQLYFDFEVLLDLAEHLPEDSARRRRLLQVLHDASNILTRATADCVKTARAMLAPELNRRGGDSPLKVSAVGHAHIDLAWLWPLRETYRKGARTFATALRMMERYPDYVFGASQPQLYQWIKEQHPKLYEAIKHRIAEGRWEVQGAMWVEPDSNVSGGEALVRQVLYGKRFFQQEFGQDMRILWVPDIFGYTASLPQILKKSGVDYMMTQKLSWNEHNTHPHTTYFWEGIDGSRVLTHMPPEDTYNGPAAPRSILKAETNNVDSNVSGHSLMLFGIGDGGGGPGEEHLERLEREKNLLGLAPVTQEPAIQFFDKLLTEQERFKTWRGELYLEKHQGTLTTQARNKRYNRKMEKLLREWEFAATLHGLLVGGSYPRQEIEQVWKETLLYQFHDILPGSSITRVYTESLERYAHLSQQVEGHIHRLYTEIANHVDVGAMSRPALVFNSLPWARTEWIWIHDTWQYVTVPAMGYQLVDAQASEKQQDGLSVDERHLENGLLRVTFDEDGTIVSMFDKVNRREIVAVGETANRLSLYHDHGNAWDFPENYRELEAERPKLLRTRSRHESHAVTLIQEFTIGDSALKQEIVLKAESAQLDFHTRVDWRESNKMLRASFPVDIQTEQVNCEIQFGHIKRSTHRNTSWDAARDEICAHQFVDLSEPNYGVALLNDCKYGYRAHGHVIDINLLRSPAYPDSQADMAVHEFTYSLLPHQGNFVDAKVFRAGYNLNVPLRILDAGASAGTAHLPHAHSLATIGSDHVMIEAVKEAEDDGDLIFRLYETAGAHQAAEIDSGFSVKNVWCTNLLEVPLEEAVCNQNTVQLSFTPFEIKTIKVSRS